MVCLATPVAVGSDVRHTDDTNFNAITVTFNVSFVRDSLSDESSPAASAISGYSLFVVRGSTLTLVQSRTLGQLGGGPGLVVENPFVVVDVDASTNRMDETKFVVLGFNSVDKSDFETATAFSFVDRAVAVCGIDGAYVQADTSMHADTVSLVVGWTRASEACESDGANNPARPSASARGYRLYLVRTDGSFALVGERSLASLSSTGAGRNVTGSSEVFSVTDVAVSGTESLAVYLFNGDGDALQRGVVVSPAAALLSVVDLAGPTAVVTNLAHTADTNLTVRAVTHAITFTRPTAAQEFGGGRLDVLGYNLFFTLGGQTTLLQSKTLAEIGGTSASDVNAFVVSDLVVDASSTYVVVAFGSEGLSPNNATGMLSSFLFLICPPFYYGSCIVILSPSSVFFGAYPDDSFFPLTNKAHCCPPFCNLGGNKAIHIQFFIKKLRPRAVLPDFTHTTNENVRNQLLGENDPPRCCFAAQSQGHRPFCSYGGKEYSVINRKSWS